VFNVFGVFKLYSGLSKCFVATEDVFSSNIVVFNGLSTAVLIFFIKRVEFFVVSLTCTALWWTRFWVEYVLLSVALAATRPCPACVQSVVATWQSTVDFLWLGRNGRIHRQVYWWISCNKHTHSDDFLALILSYHFKCANNRYI